MTTKFSNEDLVKYWLQSIAYGRKIHLIFAKHNLLLVALLVGCVLRPIKGFSARGVMVIVTGYGHGDPSSIPGRD